MSRYSCLIYVTVLLLNNVSGENVVEDTLEKGTIPEAEPEPTNQEIDQGFDPFNPDMEKALKQLEHLGTTAYKLEHAGAEADLQGYPDEVYDDMIQILNVVIEAVDNSTHAYKFLKANGLDRIIRQNLAVEYDDLKTQILILLKRLFKVAPITTTSVIPVTVVDRILDVFEKDNLALKAHSLDVLYVWLPENPRVQARVMKIKGLVPFYEQIAKLDTAVIKTLLDLFNIILKEHLRARNSDQRSAIDQDKMKFYLRIGLLEHMSTPAVCNGLLEIFSKTWSYSTHGNDIMVTIFDMLKNIKPFCLKKYRGKAKAKTLFTELNKFVKEPKNFNYFETNGLNVTEVSTVIEEYAQMLKYSVKDEM